VAPSAEGDPTSATATLPRMPFPEPETALISTIGVVGRENPIRGFIARPAASWRASTCFQSLTPGLNNLQIISTTYRLHPETGVAWMAFFTTESARHRENQRLGKTCRYSLKVFSVSRWLRG